MAEIDTRPLESVQVALNLFEQRSDHSRFSSPDRNEQEVDVLAKELATCRLQLEAKESENRQANLRLEALNKAMQELSEKYDGACVDADRRIVELETDVIAITSRQSQTASECEALRDELAAARGELDAVRRANSYVLGEVESMETRRILERESARDGLMRVLELNDAVLSSAVAAMRAEEERSVFFQEATLELLNSGRDQEAIRRQKEAIERMEEELLAKTLEVGCLRSELKKLKDLYMSSEIVAAKDEEQEPDVAQKETCLATETSREDDQVNGKMTEDVAAEVGTVTESDSTACHGDSEFADLYFDSELPGDLNAHYDEDVIHERIHGSVPEHVVEGQEEPDMEARFGAESRMQKFQRVHKQYCTDMSPGILMPENLSGKSGSRSEVVTEIVAENPEEGTPASLKRVRFLDESFKSINSDVCKIMDAGIGMPENLARKRRSEPVAAGAGVVTDIVVVDSKGADGHGEFYRNEIRESDKLGDGYVLVAKKNAGTDGEEALKDEKLDAAHAKISDLRFSLEEAVRRAELAEEAKAALERELKEEIKMKQRQPRAKEDVRGNCNSYGSPAHPRPPPPSPDQRNAMRGCARPAPSRDQRKAAKGGARPAPSPDQRNAEKGGARPVPSRRLTLGKVLNMKYK